MSDRSPIVVASNRGPIALVRQADGNVIEKRGVGGLVTAVGGATRGREASWVAAAITDEDHERVAAGSGRLDLADDEGGVLHVRLADIDRDDYRTYYDDFSNRVLWFVHHGLWDEVPDLRSEHAGAWETYRAVNARFAALVDEEAEDEALVFSQDYHLSLVPAGLRARRSDVAIAHFQHTPFAPPDRYAALPGEWGRTLLEGMLAADVVGFHADRWVERFLACCAAVLGARIEDTTVHHRGHATRVGAYPIGASPEVLAAEAAHPRVRDRLERLERTLDGRLLMLRVDRTDLSKNIVRGFLAFEQLLERREDLRARVLHAAFLTPSRGGVPEYLTYMQEVHAIVERINTRFGTPEGAPVLLDIQDDFQRTLAGFRRYDVLVVNAVSDGMNLVAREGPIVNERDGVLVLSRETGAAAELGEAALVIDPFDVGDTSRAMERALDMDADERRSLAGRLRPRAAGAPPEHWLERQIEDLQRARGR